MSKLKSHEVIRISNFNCHNPPDITYNFCSFIQISPLVSVFPLQTRFSLGAEAWPLLVVVVLDGGGVLGLLLLLGCSDTGGDFTELSLVFSVGEDLEASLLLGLHGEHLFGILLVLLEHFLFSELVCSLVKDGLLLGGVEPFEVVWLYSVWGKR